VRIVPRSRRGLRTRYIRFNSLSLSRMLVVTTAHTGRMSTYSARSRTQHHQRRHVHQFVCLCSSFVRSIRSSVIIAVVRFFLRDAKNVCIYCCAVRICLIGSLRFELYSEWHLLSDTGRVCGCSLLFVRPQTIDSIDLSSSLCSVASHFLLCVRLIGRITRFTRPSVRLSVCVSVCFLRTGN